MLVEGQPSLEGLAAVPWSALHHAYGTAEDVPDQIRALLHPDEKIRREVLFSFTCNIFHQGSRYTATVAAIPFFIELLRYEGVPEREGILDLLTYVAVPFPDEQRDNVSLRNIVKEASPFRAIKEPKYEWLRHDPETLREDAFIAHECYTAVAAGTPIYGELLRHADPRIAIASSRLIAFLPLHAFALGEHLLAIALDGTRHDLVRGSALLSLSYLNGGNVLNRFVETCASWLAEPGSAGPMPFLSTCAMLCLLRDPNWSADNETQQQLIGLAHAHQSGRGVEEPECDFYHEREIPDESESDGYYEEFFEPVPEFPWDVEGSLKPHVRSFLKKADQ